MDSLLSKVVEFHLNETYTEFKHKAVGYHYLDYKYHLIVERKKDGYSDRVMYKVDKDSEKTLEFFAKLHSGLNEHLLNLEYNECRWISVGNCRYSKFRCISNELHIVLTNEKDEFQIVLSKKTGEVLSSRNNSDRDYVGLFLNPETRIVDEL